MYGLRAVGNRLFAADKREWNKWRRDTLIRLCSDALTAAQEAAAPCESAIDQQTGSIAQANLTSASKAAARIGTIAEQLRLMNANFLADTCGSMKAAAEAINSPARSLRSYKIVAASNQDREHKKINAESPSWHVPGTPDHQEYMAKFAKVHQRTREYLAPHEKTYDDACDQLDVIRTRFIERGRIELRPISGGCHS